MSTEAGFPYTARQIVAGLLVVAVALVAFYAVQTQRPSDFVVASVDDRALTQERFHNLLGEIWDPEGDSPVFTAMRSARSVLQTWLAVEARAAVLDTKDAGVTEAHRASALAQLVSEPDLVVASVRGEASIQLVAVNLAVTEYLDGADPEVVAEFNTAVAVALGAALIDPRYGVWDSSVQTIVTR